MKTDISVRSADQPDIPGIHRIYSTYVDGGVASWELTTPSPQELASRMEATIGQGYPYLVAECSGEVVGYAYASRFRPRGGYDYTVENSVYVHPDYQQQGIGSLLMEQLVSACEERGFRQMVAVIGDSQNAATIRFHEKMGFVHVGTLPGIGFKLGQWLDCVLMQRSLGQGSKNPP